MEGIPLKRRIPLLTGDAKAIVQIYRPTTAGGCVLDQADRENATQELCLP